MLSRPRVDSRRSGWTVAMQAIRVPLQSLLPLLASVLHVCVFYLVAFLLAGLFFGMQCDFFQCVQGSLEMLGEILLRESETQGNILFSGETIPRSVHISPGRLQHVRAPSRGEESPAAKGQYPSYLITQRPGISSQTDHMCSSHRFSSRMNPKEDDRSKSPPVPMAVARRSCTRTQQKAAVCKPGGELSPGTSPTHTLISEFQPPKRNRKTSVPPCDLGCLHQHRRDGLSQLSEAVLNIIRICLLRRQFGLSS